MAEELESQAFAGARHSLRAISQLRKQRQRRPDLVMRFGAPLLESKHASGLKPIELYSIYEEVFTAALDLKDMPTAERCLKALRARFPSSNRVGCLEAMMSEAAGSFKDALVKYDAIIDNDPTNTHVMKRRVAVMQSSGNTSGAAAALVEYLDTYSGDLDAWLELTKLYTQEAQYRKATFCWEEILLLAPMNALFHCKYAETLYTLGGSDVKTARKYFAHSLNINPHGNTRALYGLLMCCHAMSAGTSLSGQSAPKGKGTREKDGASQTAELFEHAVTKLKAAYASNPSQLKLVERMIEQM